MPKVVGVRFREAGRIYYFAPNGFEDLEVGSYVVVDTARGEDIGQVVIAPKHVSGDEVVGQLKGILRRAEPWDLLQMQHFRDREEQALEKCRQKIAEYGLPMKVIKAEYNFDGSRLVFYFTAEKRVDFRKLVRELAKTFRSRIELKQVGVRDEAKLMGALGCCGRPLCCATFLCEFDPVSIKMAKQQDLPLSPMEISGICGRLLCCLAYENDYYVEVKEKLPKVGEVVVTPLGPGKVIGINVLKETLSVELESEVTTEVSAEELKTDKEPTSRRRGRRRRRR
jgi:cell fate regulator YaaT (PSP1 superfamily)